MCQGLQIKMKIKLFIGILLLSCLLSGCDLIENQLTDISGWDLSACYDGFGTCWELFTDNSDKIYGGFNEELLK